MPAARARENAGEVALISETTNQRGIDQPEEDIAAMLVDLVGLFCIAQRLLRGAGIVRPEC